MRTYLTLSLSLILAAVAHGQGTFVLWDESVNGPLSAQPTMLAPLRYGTNSLIGATEVEPMGPNWLGHPDVFNLVIPTNTTVSAIYLRVDRPNVWAWIGDATFSTELAFVPSPSSGELLSQWGLSSLSAGTYGMYLSNHDQQSLISIANYRLDFVVVPEPGALALTFLGASMLLAFCRRIR